MVFTSVVELLCVIVSVVLFVRVDVVVVYIVVFPVVTEAFSVTSPPPGLSGLSPPLSFSLKMK